MGFNFELLKSFSEYIGLDIELVTENQIDSSFSMLKSGEADLLAMGLTTSLSRKRDLLFTDPIGETRQVLVQRKPRNWRSLTQDEIDSKLVRNQIGLGKKTVYVQTGSSHIERLHTLASEIGDSINIIEVPFDSEKLIKYVADGEIDYTVCNEDIASVNAMYFSGIDVNTPVSFPQSIAWGIRKNGSNVLLAELNKWIAQYKKSGSYALLYAKYFRNSRSSRIIKSDYYTLNTGKISKYDDIIRTYSDSIKWDWRLLASLICQESHFDASVISEAGACGLMQIMPSTGRNFGIDIKASPENNIKAGIMYINQLYSIFDPKIDDQEERLSFVLASYNAGPGHVLDAIKLTEKNGMDPQKWERNVAFWLTKKHDPKYYNDVVVKSGYFRGTESINFVSEVLDRYEHYKNIIPEKKMAFSQNVNSYNTH